ncbi:hypothetical protein C0Q70_21748 [Pomacea canaliculata]|uniref:Uncharacterized protein n=1 Tax=Pomacea canaliculata TaxID=400727 RepID=A0A2T7NDD9_POMCA|nr:hypothetical protein C0Q70_21748 [Pomacea canaliculata]
MAEQKSSPAIGTRYNTRSNLRGQKKEQEQDLKNPSKQEDKDKGRPQDPQSDTRRQEDLDKGRPQDPQSNSIRQEDLGKGRPKDPQSITSKQEDLNKGSPQDPQSITSKQEDLNKDSPQDPQSITSRQEDLDKGRLKDPQSITSRQEDLDKGSQQDPQSIAIRQEDLDKGSPQDSQSTSNRQEDLDKGSPQDPQSTSNRQEDLDKGRPQDPQSITSRQEDLDKGRLKDPQSITSRQEDLDKGSQQDPQSIAIRQEDLDKGSPQDSQSTSNRQEDLDKGSPQDPQSTSNRQEDLDKGRPQDPQSITSRQEDLDKGRPQDPHCSVSQQDKDNTQSGQSVPEEPDDTAPQQDTVSASEDTNVLGGLLVIGLGLINPWPKTPDPVYNIVPSWGMCHINPQHVSPPLIDFNSSTESRIQEEMDKRETILKAHIEAQFLKLMVDVKKDMNMSAEKAIEKRILELNASTENRIKDISETLSVRLNESTENRLQDVFQEQNSWGMLVILMGAMEVILYFYICIFLNNRRPRSTDARPSVPIGELCVVILNCLLATGYHPQVAPPARVDTGDNDTLCIVYFVERDLRQLRRWMNEIIEETRAIQRMRTMNYVIASRDDIRDIPTCRLALVFVNPDERQLILEDDFHMGSTRRDTVQALHHRGAEVILIVYGDPTSRIRVLQDGSLFDPSLTQVTSHPVLKDLNSRNRILSVKESFSAHQKRHLNNNNG